MAFHTVYVPMDPNAKIYPDAPTPVMLRVYNGDNIGSTAFFRNRPLLETLHTLFLASGASTLNVLMHACSIGVEPYSLAMFLRSRGLDQRVRFTIQATDINPAFLQVARDGVYPSSVMAGLGESERVFFEPHDDGRVRLVGEIREAVQFLEPASFVDFSSSGRFDVVFVLNALTYVTPDQQQQALARIAQYNDWLLVTSAFHPETIESDLVAAGYEPVEANTEDIYNAWVERRRAVEPAPGTPEYSWVLPPFRREPGFHYRQGTIFRKSRIAA